MYCDSDVNNWHILDDCISFFKLRSQKHFPLISSRIAFFFLQLHISGTVTLDIVAENFVGSLMSTDCV